MVKISSSMGRRSAGLLDLWDERHYALEEKYNVRSERLVKVRIKDILMGDVLTLLGPTRDQPDSTSIAPVWESIYKILENAEEGTVLLGDLNAKMPSDLTASLRQHSTADTYLLRVLDELGWVEVGPAGQTYTRNTDS